MTGPELMKPLSAVEGPIVSPQSAFADTAVSTVPIIDESLQVTRRVVDRGGYQINKRVETREELVDELLRTESVEVERRKINVQVDEDAMPRVRQEGDTLIVPVLEEVLVTVKRLMLVEEVRITRTQSTHRESQAVTLRTEHIDIERLAARDGPTTKST